MTVDHVGEFCGRTAALLATWLLVEIFFTGAVHVMGLVVLAAWVLAATVLDAISVLRR